MAVPPATRVTPATALQTRPVEGFAVSDTAPAKPFREVTVIVEVPELVARILAGETGPVETLKSGCAKVPYVAGCSGIPVSLNPLVSKRLFKPLLMVTVSGFPVVPLKKTLVPGPATAV